MEFCLHAQLFTVVVFCFKVCAQVVANEAHSDFGLQVFTTASCYWSLDAVDGIHELWDQIGSRPPNDSNGGITVRIHNHTVLPSSHNSSYVYTNDSAYTNISAIVDIVEGVLNNGIFLDRDNGGTFLHFRNNHNSCISDPILRGVEGLTLTFFWKKQKEDSNYAVASGAKVISNDFSVFTTSDKGFVELYSRDDKHRWRAEVPLSGPYWTNVLFTWTKTDGLKVYINGTFLNADPSGSASENPGDISSDVILKTKYNRAHRRYATWAFDEFIIWSRALTPRQIQLYYAAAVGQDMVSTTTQGNAADVPTTATTDRVFEVSLPVSSSHQELVQSSQGSSILPVLDFLSTLPNRTIPHNAANNLTQAFLNSVEEVLSSPGLPEQSGPVVSSLIDTVDVVMGHMVTNLESSSSSSSPFSMEGTSLVADYSLMKLSQNFHLQHYRFPTQGKNYISVPGEAFTMQTQTTIVGLFYHNMHKYYKEISPVKTRIPEAADYKDHKIQVASCLISLKVEPLPALLVNHSGAPLIKIVLTHVLTKEQEDQMLNQSNKVFLYCAFLDYSADEGVWSNEGCFRSDGNMSYSVCMCNHLTNFAMLMQVVPLELTTGHKMVLSTIGYIGCSISIFCLAITLVTFAVLSSVSTIRNQRYHIHANLSFAILVAEILLLISASFEPGTLPCKVMAVLLHFFFLSAFAWMLVEGLHLYSMVVKVFGSEGSKHFYYYGIGWGSPLLICVVSVTSAFESYGDNCWLSLRMGAIWAFVAPAIFVIVVNICILISVTRIISRISGENYKVHGDANAIKLTAKAVAVLLPILGISWIFGVLAFNTHTTIFLYIFAVFNSLQGFFVFLFHCLLNSEVRAAFKHKTKVWSLTSSSIRNVNVKPFNSDIMNGNKEGVTPTKMNTWDKSTNSANRLDLSAV